MLNKSRQARRAETQIGVRIHPALVARAKKRAAAEHRTVSQVVRKLIEEWLERGAAA